MNTYADKMGQQKSPANKAKKKTMFAKRRQTTNEGSFKGDDPFNKILYPEKSRETNSIMDNSIQSRQPI